LHVDPPRVIKDIAAKLQILLAVAEKKITRQPILLVTANIKRFPSNHYRFCCLGQLGYLNADQVNWAG
jgi:hypothetical protein